MGMFDRVEKGIERAVNGAFAKAFRSEVQPVEIASALRREVDDHTTIVTRGRTVAPNTFVVQLGAADHGRLGEWEDALSVELGDVVVDHAGTQHYAFVGPVTVSFEEADDLDTGLFRVRSSKTPGPAASARRADRQGPSVASAPAASRSPQQVSLEVAGRTHHVTKPVSVIGRGADADVVVDDAGVSRRHSEIHVEGGRVWVTDLGSTNGTFVDGEKVSSGELADGSRIKIGRTQLVVHFGSW